MNRSVDDVLSYLTGNRDINVVTVEDIRKLVAESPYFPVAHFLLAKKLKEEANWEASRDVQKVALYFSNPLWLQYQLTEKDVDEDEFEELRQRRSTEKQVEPVLNVDPPAPPTDIATGSQFSIEEAGPANTNTDPSTAITDAALEQSNVQEDAHVHDELIEQVDEELGVKTPTQNEEETVSPTTSTSKETENEVDGNDRNSASATLQNTPILAEVPAAAEQEVTEFEEEMAGVSHNADITTERFLEETEHEPENGEHLQDEHDKMFQNIKAMLDASTEEADADTSDVVVPIDPYYTIDYFASQGIKLELDKNPQDQLGQNLKKFTQWLRHMKKLGPEDATEVINRTETEADIQQIADSSNTVREVVTEAMASVLEKQGKREKAIELYNKLSFLYPHKNAYFADKIKKLKGF